MVKVKHIPNLSTLAFVYQDGQVLLGRKKYGEGKGMVIVPRGKVEYKDRVIVRGVIRETPEESGLRLKEVEAVSLAKFIKPPEIHWSYAFRSHNFDGEVIDTDELEVFWCAVDKIPYNQTWPDDKYWLPQAMADDLNIIEVKYNKLDGELQGVSVQNVNELPSFAGINIF